MLLPDTIVGVRDSMELWAQMHDYSKVVIAVQVCHIVRRYPWSRPIRWIDYLHVLRKLAQPSWVICIVSNKTRIERPVARFLLQVTIKHCRLLNIFDDSNVLGKLA